MHFIFLLHDQDQNQVDSEQSVFGVLAQTTKVQDQRALLNEKKDIDQLVPVLQWDEGVLLQTLLLGSKVTHGDHHDGHQHHLVKHSLAHGVVGLSV